MAPCRAGISNFAQTDSARGRELAPARPVRGNRRRQGTLTASRTIMDVCGGSWRRTNQQRRGTRLAKRGHLGKRPANLSITHKFPLSLMSGRD